MPPGRAYPGRVCGTVDQSRLPPNQSRRSVDMRVCRADTAGFAPAFRARGCKRQARGDRTAHNPEQSPHSAATSQICRACKGGRIRWRNRSVPLRRSSPRAARNRKKAVDEFLSPGPSLPPGPPPPPPRPRRPGGPPNPRTARALPPEPLQVDLRSARDRLESILKIVMYGIDKYGVFAVVET